MTTQFALDLRLARRKAGYTQADLAHLINTKQSVVSDYERGTLRPTLDQIVALSLIYGRSFESFFSMVMDEQRTALQNRLASLPDPGQTTAHTFNRDGSLARLAHRLKQDDDHGGA